MAEKTAGEIFEDMKNAQEAQIEANRQKYRAQKDALAANAASNAEAESAGGSADYQDFIMPNNNGSSIQADAISRLGFNKGSLSETNRAGGYNAYQSRLAAAAQQAQNSKDQLELMNNMYDKQLNAAKSNVQANYNAMKNSDYWKQANWDYQLAADKKAEEEAKKAEEAARKAAAQYYYLSSIDPGDDPPVDDNPPGGNDLPSVTRDTNNSKTGSWFNDAGIAVNNFLASLHPMQKLDKYQMNNDADLYAKRFASKYSGVDTEEADEMGYYYSQLLQGSYNMTPEEIDAFENRLYNIQTGNLNASW